MRTNLIIPIELIVFIALIFMDHCILIMIRSIMTHGTTTHTMDMEVTMVITTHGAPVGTVPTSLLDSDTVITVLTIPGDIHPIMDTIIPGDTITTTIIRVAMNTDTDDLPMAM